jgi:hypothetical protein
LLGHAEYEIDEALVQSLVDDNGLSQAAADELRTIRGQRFQSEARLQETIETFNSSAELFGDDIFFSLLRKATIEDCGKKALLPGAVEPGSVEPGAVEVDEDPAGVVARERIASGDLSDFTTSASGKRLVIDPERGRFLFLGDPPPGKVKVTYHYGFSGKIGAGSYSRPGVEVLSPDQIHQDGGALTGAAIENEGVTQINDSATYGPIGDKLSVKNLTLQAANSQRPYLRMDSNWVLNTGNNTDAQLRLDGLWIGAKDTHEIILRGDY